MAGETLSITSCAGLALIIVISAATPCRAQESELNDYAVVDLSARCIALDPDTDAAATRECSVQEFGHLAAIDSYDFYYALYRDLLEIPSELNLEVWDRGVGNRNVLLMFAGERGANHVGLMRSWFADRRELGPYAYRMPEIISTELGPVLHVIRHDNGDGMTQWFNHEYWLWQWGGWLRLDVSSWYDNIHSFVPSDHRVQGVSYNHFDLAALKNISPVRKHGDPDCCPSGGIITVDFEWVGLSLSVTSVAHDPDTDFRSMVR